MQKSKELKGERVQEEETIELDYGGFATGSMVPSESEIKMALTCKNCKREFNSTFSIDDFACLSEDQHEAGTLHLCPFCGTLTIYQMTDYHESNVS